MKLPILGDGSIRKSAILKDSKLTEKLSSKYNTENIVEAAYCYHNNFDIQKCFCEKPKIFKSFIKGYLKTCGDRSCMEKSRENTSYKKYGVKNVFLDNNVQEKIKSTCMEKYGVDHPSKSSVSIQKRIDTWNSNGGHPMQRDNNTQFFRDKSFVEELLLKKPRLYDICSEYGISYSFLCQRINEFDLEFPSHDVSTPQREVNDYVESLGLETKQNDRTRIPPLEIDILVNDLAIEVNGIYWHSYNYREDQDEKNKHFTKYKKCRDVGLKFLSFTDYEWYEKQDIIKSIIKSRLGLSNIRIYGRNTDIKKLDTNIARGFINENHLKGYTNSSIKIGLFYKNNLVSVATFGISRYTKDKTYELIRMCHKLDTSVVGGTSKLIKHFLRTYSDNLISYSDNDKFDGKSYLQCGFSEEHVNSPSYYYWRKDIGTINRLAAQKHKQHKLLDHFNNELTEAQNMFNNGYRRYWNCGTTKWKIL